jgi:hypothetical protein
MYFDKEVLNNTKICRLLTKFRDTGRVYSRQQVRSVIGEFLQMGRAVKLKIPLETFKKTATEK